MSPEFRGHLYCPLKGIEICVINARVEGVRIKNGGIGAKDGHSSMARIAVSKTVDLGSNPGARAGDPNLKNKRMSKIRAYIDESVDELLNKVSWPTWSELQSSSLIVLVASVIIALIVFVMDSSFNKLMEFIYSIF